MHPSVILQGHTLPCTVHPGHYFGCPLCLKFRTRKEGVIRRHLHNHSANAVHCQDVLICRCNRLCRSGGHFHCPFCPKVLRRKEDMVFHAGGCQRRWDATLLDLHVHTTSLLDLQLSRRIIASSVRTEHSYTLPLWGEPPVAAVFAAPPPAGASPEDDASPPAETLKLPFSHVKCRRCPAVVLKKNLLSHILRKHTPVITCPATASRLGGGAAHGTHSTTVTAPARHQTWSQKLASECETEACRQYLSRSHHVQQIKEEDPCWSRPDQQDLQIKEEPADLEIGQQGEQLQELKEEEEEEEISGSSFLHVIVKEEDEEWEVDELHQTRSDPPIS